MNAGSHLNAILGSHRRTLAAVIAVTLFTSTFVAVHEAISPVSTQGTTTGAPALSTPGTIPGIVSGGNAPVAGGVVRTGPGTAKATPKDDVRFLPPGTYIEGKGTVPLGIDGNKLRIVYYWDHKTRNSQFLEGGDSDLDEGKAFKALIRYINKHRSGTFMGFDYDLHGWELVPIVDDAGKFDDQIRAAERIATSWKPFLAISSHGSVSTNVCPRLARAGIFNISTYDLSWDILGRTNGYCLPAGISFDDQVDLTIAYLKKLAQRPYELGAVQQERRFGMVYAEYKGLKDIAAQLKKRLEDEGITIHAFEPVDPDLTVAQRQQPLVVAAFRRANVNTVIAPESGSLISFTHAADAAAAWTPDYYVWPCSGQDSLGMVRLYSATQWERARGLSCYDEHLNADLTMDGVARDSEWYDMYTEVSDDEPPAPTALIYQGVLPLLVGLTHTGKDLTIERFRDGLAGFSPYRYDAIDGRTKDRSNLLVTIGSPNGSVVGDAAEVYWDKSESRRGATLTGTYVYSDRRYRPGTAF